MSKFLSVTLAVMLGFSSGCGPTTGPVASTTAAPMPKVQTTRPTRTPIRKTVEQPGQVESAKTSPIHARTVGLVKAIHVDIGDHVTWGQSLADLALPEVVADLDHAKAVLIEAEAGRVQAQAAIKVEGARVVGAEAKLGVSAAGVRRAEADLARRKAEFARVQSLARESAVTTALVDEAQSVYLAAEAARDEALAQVQFVQSTILEAQAAVEKSLADAASAVSKVGVAKAKIQQSQAMLSYASIASPFAGVITRRNVDPGQLVGGYAANAPLFVVARTDLLTIAVSVPEIAAPQVKLGATALITIQSLPGKPIEGKVSRTAFSLDSTSRGLRVEIDLPGADPNLRPGMYALATIVLDEHPHVLAIPTTSVLKDGAKVFCMKVEDGKVHRVAITTGLVDGPLIEVTEGLSEGDTLVKTSPASLVDGQSVIIAP